MPVAECVCSWHRGATSWRSGTRAVVAVSAVVLANLSIGAGMVILQFSREGVSVLRRSTAAIALFNSVTVALAASSYLLVSRRAKRSSQLHLHGFALVLMLVANTAYIAAEVLFPDDNTCTLSAMCLILNYIVWGSYKAPFFLLMKEKMTALGPPISRYVQAQLWGRALVLAVMLAVGGGITALATGLVLLLQGYPCLEVQRVATLDVAEAKVPVAGKAVILAALFFAFAGVACLYVGGFGMMYSAHRLARRAVKKLRERDVPEEELRGVRRTLRQHVLGLFIGITTTLLVISLSAGVDGLDGFGEVTENLVGGLVITVDICGDVIAILLLSGIGSLLIREDPEAGEISGHLRSLLHAAVLTSRGDHVFEGRVAKTASGVCVASFPGKFLAEWNALTWACEQGDLSSACVFLPTSDSKGRFGKHVWNPETPGTCWCHSLYGEEKPWGCAWFQEWKENIERAVDLGLELVAVFFPGEAGRGTVAYMKLRGFPVTEEDLETFKQRGWGMKRPAFCAASSVASASEASVGGTEGKQPA